MHKLVAEVVAWLASNAVALVVGGYLGYRFGDKVEALAVRLLGYARKI